MRKGIWAAMVAAIGLSGAGVALAGAPTTNKQGFFIDLSVKASPPIAGTAKHPRGVGIEFDSFSGNRIDGNRQFINRVIFARFGSGFKDNAGKFPACQLQLKKLSKCSKADQIGTGSAEASLQGKNGAPPSFVAATLVTYNGSSYHGHPTLIAQAIIGGKPAVELDFTVANKSSGPWGVIFTSIPAGGSTGSSLTITMFDLTIPTESRMVHGSKIHLVTAPDTCHGFWKFELETDFTHGAPLIATDTEPCTK
ncbi:MAG TPA: hypothetical protein VGF70_15675 [Solirubrobacteraceae bacterium]